MLSFLRATNATSASSIHGLISGVSYSKRTYFHHAKAFSAQSNNTAAECGMAIVRG